MWFNVSPLVRYKGSPIANDCRDGVKAVGQRGRAGLQNDVGFHLMQGAPAHGWDAVESFAAAKTLRTEAFSAP